MKKALIPAPLVVSAAFVPCQRSTFESAYRASANVDCCIVSISRYVVRRIVKCKFTPVHEYSAKQRRGQQHQD
jgi:hypothetical protein